MRTHRRPSLLLLALVLLSSCAAEPDPGGAVLITVDTLRADHVGAWSSEARTPRIDALAREGVVFERATSPLPLTRPAHFSMLTALYPREHGVLNNSTALPEAARTFPEILRENGWRTAGFTAVRILDTDSGAAQGFEHFEGTGRRRQRRGDEVVEHALAWLGRVPSDAPFFLWVHLFDPHLPYEPAAQFRTRVDPEHRAKLAWRDLVQIASANAGDVPAGVLENARQLYRGEVSAADHAVGVLLDGIAARRDLDRLLVILTADHGECFERGVWFEHSDCLAEGALHVPLIVRHPESFPAGSRAPQPVTLADVAPTVLRAAGLEPPKPISGRPLQDSADFGDRHLLVQYPFYDEASLSGRRARAAAIRSVAGQPVRPLVTDAQWVGIVGPRWKFLSRDGVEELYPIAPEADESENRAAAEPGTAAEMRARLSEALAAHPLTIADPGEVSEELRHALEALGYVE